MVPMGTDEHNEERKDEENNLMSAEDNLHTGFHGKLQKGPGNTSTPFVSLGMAT